MSRFICLDCGRGEFDRLHPGKWGVCEKFGAIKSKRECAHFIQKNEVVSQ